MNLLFVCTGNTCRSPMAEAYFKALCRTRNCDSIRVSSAGVGTLDGKGPSGGAMAVMQEEGLDLSGFTSTRFTPELAKDMELIVCMSPAHLTTVAALAPEATAILLLPEGIGDPYGGSVGEYRRCFQRMKPALEELFERLN